MYSSYKDIYKDKDIYSYKNIYNVNSIDTSNIPSPSPGPMLSSFH